MGNKRHIKKGDTVYVLSGNERGRSGKVIDVQTANERVVVEGLNMVKKHIRKNQDQPQGEIAEREGTIHWSNVMREDRYLRNRTVEEAATTEQANDEAKSEE
ncbi:MAG: 50S ribosomal protein L24 [Verrucomicrobiales bacterium]|mgnify:FL=1|jgi:large subunit ribosomal protein L24|nr:50S ribosomal protein L24 [Verrucomicrobiales bacterium]MBS33624.1 50S ribosomal protein L24 [Verrucomicrobiales bacterium]MDP6678383.1 50S ribosomal protein L24 [Verrucomicrobiota bacterium]MDP6753397.1 50S ribosomal protein L24 [Verrucomicrobiota bacterium]MDP7012866.1 50S ribosomal protein L24 [Verrucomicrobiota bacterium]|tara:strand:- start:1357 stop:1662 length:306 start_codon:yes stop_codon:yes gene_type:complete